MTIRNTIVAGTYNVHQMDAREFCTLCDAENLVMQIANHYEEGTVLMNPNTGEAIMTDELKRAGALLAFLTECRVVEVNP